MKKVLFFIVLLFFLQKISAQEIEYVTTTSQKGDVIKTLFSRYNIPLNKQTVKRFKNLNRGKFVKNDGLIAHIDYALPILIYPYNGKSIRASIGNYDYDYAKKIESYNDNLFAQQVKPDDFRIDKEIWVPVFNFELKPDFEKKEKIIVTKSTTYPIFGKNYEKVIPIDKKLKNKVFYLISGHGGPDPGAVGFNSGYELHEDEYAYDVTLRLAHKLMEHSAEVYIIVQDPEDGIRDERYLNNSTDEFYLGGYTISSSQLERLAKSTEIVNQTYNQTKKKKQEQYSIVIHVDSRYEDQKIDIFFYYNENNQKGKKFAETLKSTIVEKYEKAQPGRGYNGSVTSRSLYLLRNLKPVSVFIEIGNIQNPRDQIRILEPNNRQAIANWLTDGVIKEIGK
jgi:N-acetylmuramoyl-L-alanine amidase